MKIYFLLFFFKYIFTRGTKNEVNDLFDGLYSGKIYSGYLETKEPENELFYIYMPSQTGSEDENNQPLLLWLNGGPGCSSFIGMLTEIGPIVTKLYSNQWIKNEYSWNKNLNVLFIENPAGVGFTKAKENITYSEKTTAENLLEALNNFFELFEHLKTRDFYVTGESYAGIYIPNLTEEIFNTNSTINLKGILIGNPMTSHYYDYDRSTPDFALSHGLIDLETYLNFSQNCPCVKPEKVFKEIFGLENYETKCNISIDDEAEDKVNLVSTSIGIISNRYKKYNDLKQTISSLISTHKLAKYKTGSSYIFERPKISAEGSINEAEPNNNILIAEPDEALSILLEATARLQGYNVKVVNEFDDIFSILKEFNPAVIILDAGNTETLKGLEICKKLKFETTDIKSNIIFTTTVHDKEMVLNAGADLYLPKPYELSVMFGWIKKFNENYNS